MDGVDGEDPPVTAILIQFGKLLGDKKMVFAFVFEPLECFKALSVP
jgi:hypothetical protein